MYDNITQQLKIGDEVTFVRKTKDGKPFTDEGKIFAESLMNPGSYIVINRDRLMIGPLYPRELLKV